MYIITIKGKKHKYYNLESAIMAASEIFSRTGIIVGIEKE